MMKNVRNLVIGIGALTILGLLPQQAQAVTVKFEGVAPAGGSAFGSHTESGFTFEGIGGTIHGVLSDTFGIGISNGTDVGYWTADSQTIQISATDSSPFSFQSFDAGQAGNPGGLLNVTGNLNGGGTPSDIRSEKGLGLFYALD